MPIFAIGVKSLYVTFNPNAKDSYTENSQTIMLPVYYESNEVNSFNDIIIGNIYRFENINTITTTTYYGYVDINLFNRQYEKGVGITEVFLYTTNANQTLYRYVQNGSTEFIYFDNTKNLVSFTQLQGQFSVYDNFNFVSQNIVNYYSPYTYTDTIDNVFYYSVEQISNESLFNWANNTFLAQPLLFITNLFGVPSTSPIITILCYWFAISVIWLVFDVIMYIPLLVHRWLDKGVIE